MVMTPASSAPAVPAAADAEPAPPVRVVHGVAGLGGARQVDFAEPLDLLALVQHDRERRLDLRARLDGGRVALVGRALDLGSRPRDLALVTVEHPQRNTDAEPEGIVGPDPLILHLGRNVPPGVGARQVEVCSRAHPRGGGRLHVRPRGHALLQQALAVEGHLAENELAGDVELARHRVRADGGSQRNAGDILRLSGVAQVALECEALDLDPQQLQLGEVALVHAEAIDALDLVERPEVVAGQLQGGAGGQRVGERLLHLRGELTPGIGQLELADPARRPRTLDPALALAAQLDGL
jgi:hypothetical protein